GENIRANEHLALMSRELATIDLATPLDFTVDDIPIEEINEDALIQFFKRLELKALAINFRKKNDTPAQSTPQNFNYEVLEDETQLSKVLNQNLAIYFEFSDFNYHKADLWGIGLSNGINHYFVSAELLLQSDTIKNYLANPKFEKYVYEYKGMKVYMKWHNLDLAG